MVGDPARLRTGVGGMHAGKGACDDAVQGKRSEELRKD